MPSNTKKKICHIASIDITVGFLLMPQLKFLKDQGYDVHVVCSPGRLTKEIEKEGIYVKNIEITRKVWSPIKDLISFYKLYRFFKSQQFDIVHTHAPKPGLLGQLAAKLAGVPVIINTIHGLYFTPDTPYVKRQFFILIEKMSASCSTLIFSQNKEDIQTMVYEKIAKPEKIKYLGNGINVEKFNPAHFSKEDILAKKGELQVNSASPIIGIVGRLVEEKGYLDLFLAFKRVLQVFPQTQLLVIGPEDPQKKDKISPTIADKYGIENNILFLGQRNDVAALYPLMDVFVLPSHREGFPRSVIEAMASKLPIVVTDIRGCREEIDNGINGLMVPVKNPEKLAMALIDLLENKAKAQSFAEQAMAKAYKEFNEELVFSKLHQEYKRLSEKKAKICHVATVDITVQFILRGTLQFLKSQNYDVSIVCSDGPWVDSFRQEGFMVHTIKMLRKVSPFADIIPFIKLYFYFKKEKFDIVHTHTPKAGVLGRIAARLAGVPVVIHSSHGFYTGVKIDPRTRASILFAEKVASHFCDLVTSQNREDVAFAIKEKIVSAKKIIFLHYGISLDRFNPTHFTQDDVLKKKKELGIGSDKKVIGMVGRFVEEKGYLDLFAAFQVIKQHIPSAILLLVAPKDPQKADALDASILQKYHIEKDTVLLGHEHEITNIEQVYAMMDVFVLPSFREGFPFSIMEASAMEKPVVATNIRGCKEAVDDGVTGTLVPTSDPQKLADALMYFLKNPDAAKKMGLAGRKKAEKEFNEQVVFNSLQKEYDTLLAIKK